MVSPESLIPSTVEKASVIDIVSYGYRKAITHIWPLTIVALPVILLCLVRGFDAPIRWQSSMEAIKTASINHTSLHPNPYASSFWIWIVYAVAVYSNYCISLYARDAYFNQTDRPLYTYLFGETKTLRTLLVYSAFCLLAIIPAGLIGIVGLVLLILPGVAWITYTLMASNIIYAFVLQSPNSGAKYCIKESLRLLKNNASRTVGLGLLTWIISTIIYMPMLVLTTITMTNSKPSNSFIMSILCALCNGLGVWVSSSLIVGGWMFITYRYIADLKIRHGDVDADSMLPAPIEAQA